MGVKWLLQWRPISAGGEPMPASAQDEDVLVSIVEQLGCKLARDKLARLEVKCTLLRQQSPQQPGGTSTPGTTMMQDLWLAQFNDTSDTCYLIDRAHHTLQEHDNGVLALLEKKLEYRIRQCVTFTGKRYVKGDFGVRIASASSNVAGTGHSGTALLGHIIELEYYPVSCPVQAAGMMAGFTELLRAYIPLSGTQPVGALEKARDSSDMYAALGENGTTLFTHMHTAVMYQEASMHFMVMQRQQAAATGGTAQPQQPQPTQPAGQQQQRQGMVTA